MPSKLLVPKIAWPPVSSAIIICGSRRFIWRNPSTSIIEPSTEVESADSEACGRLPSASMV